MRELNKDEITTFANRNGAKKIAVENFLMSMGTNEICALFNMDSDRTLYSWNRETVDAIESGIIKASRSWINEIC